MDGLLADPAFRLFAVTYLLLVLKMMVVGSYTSFLRLTRRVFATPEDYALVGRTGGSPAKDDQIERVRRAHRNDLENILPFFPVGFFYALGHPSMTAARVYFLGFLVARVLHSVFYIRAMQPHRSIAFGVGAVLMVAMLATVLVRLLGA